MQLGSKQVNMVSSDLVWIRCCKGRIHAQRKSKLVPHADGPIRVLKKVGVGVEDGMDLRANPFQQGGYDVPHHGKLEPREGELKFEGLTKQVGSNQLSF